MKSKIKTDIRLLKKCAKKYEARVALLKNATTFPKQVRVIRSIAFGKPECALCAVYYGNDDPYCANCPIQQKTGQTFCIGTPYQPKRNAENTQRAIDRGIGEIHGECLWAVFDERKFAKLYTTLTKRCEREAEFLTKLATKLASKL